MSGNMLEQSNYTKLTTASVYLQALSKFDDFVGVESAVTEHERDPTTGILRKMYTPGSVVSAPVEVNNQTFYWPAIIEFSPEIQSDYVRTLPNLDGTEERHYFVTLITVYRSSWFGAWVKQSTLKPFNVLTEPGKNDASHVPDAESTFDYVKEHLFMSPLDRLLKLSFMSFLAYCNNVSRWAIK